MTKDRTVKKFKWKNYNITAIFNGNFNVDRLAKSIIETVDEFEAKKNLKRRPS